MFFSWSETFRVDPSWSDPDWQSELIRSDFCTCLFSFTSRRIQVCKIPRNNRPFAWMIRITILDTSLASYSCFKTKDFLMNARLRIYKYCYSNEDDVYAKGQEVQRPQNKETVNHKRNQARRLARCLYFIFAFMKRAFLPSSGNNSRCIVLRLSTS